MRRASNGVIAVTKEVIPPPLFLTNAVAAGDITTEKDAVRMPRLADSEMKVPIYFLRVEIQILSGQESWEHCVTRICKPQPVLPPERFFA